jgi:hypothetical protein
VASVVLFPAFADDGAADKSNYTLLNPTPDADMRSFNTDRPPKADSPYSVDAGHFQYETDIAVFSSGDTGGVQTRNWTVGDLTFKLGVTNTIDAALQITPYGSTVTNSAAGWTSVSGVGDTVMRLKFNVLGNDHGAVAVALLPYVKPPTARSGLGRTASSLDITTVVGETPYRFATAAIWLARSGFGVRGSGLLSDRCSSRCRNCSNESLGICLRRPHGIAVRCGQVVVQHLATDA